MPETESRIELASPQDLDSLLQILHKANEYALAKSGTKQWSDAMIGHIRQELTGNVVAGNSYVFRDSDAIHASISLVEEDTFCWGEEGRDGQAIYFHQLMKDPESSVRNTGATLLHFAAEQATDRGKPYLRCDVKPSLADLINYYERIGMDHRQRLIEYPLTTTGGLLMEGVSVEVLRKTTETLA